MIDKNPNFRFARFTELIWCENIFRASEQIVKQRQYRRRRVKSSAKWQSGSKTDSVSFKELNREANNSILVPVALCLCLEDFSQVFPIAGQAFFMFWNIVTVVGPPHVVFYNTVTT